MNKTRTTTLDDAMAAVQTLPEEAQAALAEELVALVEDYRSPGLSDAQREVVSKRLAHPRKHVARGDFLAMLRRYNPAL